MRETEETRTDMKMLPAQRLLAKSSAILLVIGLLTGVFVSAAMTGKISADPGAALASHLNALMGCFWMASVGWTLPMLAYGERALMRLAWATLLPNFANWAVTVFKAMLKVKGVDAIGEGKNDLVFGLLTFLVVLPSLAAAGAWAWGFRKIGDKGSEAAASTSTSTGS
jgi:(hydroxyamino)benzene mutase